MNTILSYITRQSTLTKLAEAGIATFADAANTKLRPAIDIMADITDKWLDKAEDMPEALVDIADSMGLFSEEIADAVGLTESWNDLQKIEVEQSVAGVRRRQFLIGLMRNFNMVQEVTNNLHDVEGYSMAQNIRTMKTLEKQYAQLQMELTRLAEKIGESGLTGQLKALTGFATDAVSVFTRLDSGLQTFILTLGEVAIAMGIVKSMMGMMGGGAAITAFTAAAGPWALPAIAVAGAGVVAYALHTRKLREEHEQYIEVVSGVAKRQEQLDKIIEKSVKGSISYNTAIEEKQELLRAIVDQYPSLFAGYDTENEMILLNAEALRKANDEKERSIELSKKEGSHRGEKIQQSIDEIESIKAQIEQHDKQAKEYEDDARRLRNLSQTRRQLIKEIEKEGEGSEEAANKKEQLKYVDEAIIRISVRASDVIKETSDITVEAINNVIEAYEKQGEAAREAKTAMINEEIKTTESTIKLIRERLMARQQEIEVMKKLKFRELEAASQQLIESGAIHPYDPYHYTTTDIFAQERMADALAMGNMEEAGKEIRSLEGDLILFNKTLTSLENQLSDLATVTDDSGKYLANTKDKAKKLTDVINKYIATVLRAADVQGMLNDETQRTIDGYRAKIDYLTRDNATAGERAEALRLEADLTEKLREKQEGVHQEANFLREALAKLEQYQRGVNTTTEEGWEAYKKLEAQIESIKAALEKLGIEWFNLAKAQEETIVQTKNLQDALKDLDFYARLGVTTVEEQLIKTKSIYNEISSIRAMTVAEEYDMIQRVSSAYKQMFLDMKRDAENAYRERIKQIDKESEAVISGIQAQIDALDEATKAKLALIQEEIDALDDEEIQESRDEERYKHEEKMADLLEKRRYHEVRTGREHSEAIVDIDRQIAEEDRRWKKREASWVRDDKKAALRAEMQDVRDDADEKRGIYRDMISDERQRAKEQKEIWGDYYEAMLEDFSDYNISMIALAATYDPDFWEDAKNKGELWTKGFKDGTVGFVAYLDGLIAKAKNITLQSGGVGYYGGDSGTYWDTGGSYAGGNGTGTGQYVGGSDDDHGWEVIDHGDHYYVPGIGDVPKGARGGVLDSPRFVFAGEAGNEALIPLDKLQPMLSDALSNSILTNELIFPPNLSAQLEKLIGVLTTRPLSPSVAQEQWRSGGDINKKVSIAGNLLNVERAMFEDETDMEILAREINRQLTNLSN